MQRISSVHPSQATGSTKRLLDLIQERFGRVPNALRVLARSPAAFEAWWAFDEAIQRASISRPLQEMIAVLVAELNGCDYCLSAHSAAGQVAGVTSDELVDARRGVAADPRQGAVLRFVEEVVATRGDVADGTLELVRSAGLSDAELIEILGVVAINTFNNFYNRLARTTLDFPLIELFEGSRPGSRR